MTRQEHIARLEAIKNYCCAKRDQESLDFAINALKVDEAYQLEYEDWKAYRKKKMEEWAIDKSDEFEEWKLNEDKDCYLRIGDIVDRFKEIDEHYNHSPWNLTQIFSNLNVLQRTEPSISKKVLEGAIDKVEDYVCDHETDAVKAQGMCDALTMIEGYIKEQSE